METVIRGYIITDEGQLGSYYFENTISNIANFIFANAQEDNEIRVDNIFGRTLINYVKKENQLKGKKDVVKSVDAYIKELSSGGVVPSEVCYLDLHDMNDNDEFDSRELRQKWMETYVRENHF